MFYPMRGMEFPNKLPPYRGTNILGAISQFVRHVPGPKVHDRDIVAIVEICRDYTAEAGQRGCRTP